MDRFLFWAELKMNDPWLPLENFRYLLLYNSVSAAAAVAATTQKGAPNLSLRLFTLFVYPEKAATRIDHLPIASDMVVK